MWEGVDVIYLAKRVKGFCELGNDYSGLVKTEQLLASSGPLFRATKQLTENVKLQAALV